MRHHTDAVHVAPTRAAALRPLRLGGRLPRVGGLAIESHTRGAALDAHAQARHAAWVSANALAACGFWVTSEPAPGDAPVWLPDADAPRLLAVLSAVPALPIGESLPWATRSVLLVLGVPTARAAAPTGEVRVVVGDPTFAPTRPLLARVSETATGYHVSFDPPAST
ncbi:MAG: hypothetical protein K8W52_38610 [Deltaproteobacteria bacterium]|nr:hypothetical protein [Deltaproteobacteria bacterium]